MNPASEVLFSSDLWETALEKYALATHMTVKLFDAKLRTVCGPIHPTPLFQLFEESGYDPGIFSECARRCLLQTENRPTVIVSQIQGLAVVGTSLLLEGKVVGAAVGGYVLADFSQVSEIQRLARQADIGFERLWEVARQQQPVPQNRLIVNGELLQVLGDALLRENYRTRQNAETAAIVASSDDAIVSKDLSGVITSWNRGAERIFGYTASEAVGQSITMLIPDDRAEEEPMILGRIRRGESVDHYETVRRCKNGSLLDISLTVSPIKDTNGRVVGASKIARDITARKHAEDALRVSETKLQAELADTQLLHSISAQLVREENVDSLYEKILDSAGSIMRSDFASMQVLYPERGSGGELRLLAFRGFTPEAAAFWEWVGTDSAGSTCGAALRTGKRVIAADIEKCDFMTGSEDRAMYLQTGIRACQTTPLLSRSGKVLGMISTHWRQPHEPSERDLRVLDILARQAADLIERKHAADALRDEEERFRMLADNMSQLAWTCDLLGNVTWYNERWYDYTGTTFEEMKDWGWEKVQHPDHLERVVRSVMHSRESGEIWEDTFPLRSKSGEYRWFLSRAIPIRNKAGRVVRWFGTNTDITNQREAEQQLQHAHDELESIVEQRTASLRQLSSHLQHVQDDERRRIARELHDSAGQYLAALKMNLAQLKRADVAMAEALLAESEQLLDTCLAEIRTISYLLHPPMLDESGLASAAAWYLEGFAKRSNIQAQLEISSRFERLPADTEIVLFRALQESLTNVHRHSQSSKVDVRLEVENSHAVLLVRDYGRGFPPGKLEGRRAGSDLGVGLAGMRERVTGLGGILELFAEQPGTSLKVTLPIAESESLSTQTMESSADRSSAA